MSQEVRSSLKKENEKLNERNDGDEIALSAEQALSDHHPAEENSGIDPAAPSMSSPDHKGELASAPEDDPSGVLLVDKEELKGRLEAVLFAAGDPISVREMAALLEVVPDTVEVILDEMEEAYGRLHRGITILRLDDRLQLATKPEYSRWVLKLAQVNERQTLSKGALECLAIVAYKQPVTRVQVDEIRGVSSDYVMNKLLDRGFITVIGRKNVPGRPKLYATTEEFLRQFGFSNLKVFTSDETYQELIGSLAGAENETDEIILPITDEEEDLENQMTIWDQKERS